MSTYNKVVHVEVKDNYKLVVYEYNYGLRGDFFETEDGGYNFKKVTSAKFFYEDGDASVYRVREYFGFTSIDK